jgi:peroxiredoxin
MGDILQPGTKAPDFSSPVTPDQKLALSDLRGKRVILAFYPADWSPVCGDQMTLYNMVLPEFRKHGAELLGISVDGAWCHQAYARHNNLHFPLIADAQWSYCSPIAVNPGADGILDALDSMPKFEVANG